MEKGVERVMISARLPVNLVKRLDQLVLREKWTRQKGIEIAIREFLRKRGR